jgi:hypothetical protein
MKGAFRAAAGTLTEYLRLRVKDVDFAQRQIIVRDGKGMEARVTMLPGSLVTPLQGHLVRVNRRHERDLAAGYGSVYLPFAPERKFPHAHRTWIWQYVFPYQADCPSRIKTDLIERYSYPGQRSESFPARVENGREIPCGQRDTGGDGRIGPNDWAIAQPGVHVGLFRPAGLTHHLHDDFVQIGAGGVEGVNAAY